MPLPPRSAILQSLHFVVLPLARLCVRHSIKLDEVLEVLKRTMLDVAALEMERQQTKPSDSRLSVITGVHRKDVARIRKQPGEVRESKNIVVRVIGQWLQDQRFTTSGGKPRVLAVDGEEISFSQLVKSVSADLHPLTVLYELERMNAVERTKDKVRLLTDIHLTKGNFKAAFGYLERDVDDLINTVENNLASPDDELNLHLRTEYDNIPLEFVAKIRNWLLEEGSKFHEKARKFVSQYDRDTAPYLAGKEGRARISIATFSRTEEDFKE